MGEGLVVLRSLSNLLLFSVFRDLEFPLGTFVHMIGLVGGANLVGKSFYCTFYEINKKKKYIYP